MQKIYWLLARALVIVALGAMFGLVLTAWAFGPLF